METEPYNLQSPEQIAKDYGGNKQKIAEAMQMGILDPTAGTLAAMFIDRMRNAAQQESAPQQSVAQQVFAPPAPQMPQGMPPMPPMAQGAPAGLGATPEAAAMPAPEEAMMGAPGMAAGGMVPPYMASGGLTDLPLPDGMFDENRNGGFNDGYRGGGLVAFARGDAVDDEDEIIPEGRGDEIVVTGQRDEEQDLSPLYMRPTIFQAPNFLGGYDNTLGGNLATYNQEVLRETRRAQENQAYLDRMLSPEERKARRKEDMWAALGQIGARMASTPGSLLQAASAGMAEALPGISAAAKERRGEERALRQELVAEERTGNREREARAAIALDMLKGYNDLEKALQNDNFRNLWESLGRETQIRVAQISGAFGLAGARESASASRFGSQLGYSSALASSGAQAERAFSDFLGSSAGTIAFNRLVANGTTPDTALATLRSSFFGGAPSATTGTPPPPAGARLDR